MADLPTFLTEPEPGSPETAMPWLEPVLLLGGTIAVTTAESGRRHKVVVRVITDGEPAAFDLIVDPAYAHKTGMALLRHAHVATQANLA